jgi:sulfatase maturation enzyme AslB (radical SAM superfamily)
LNKIIPLIKINDPVYADRHPLSQTDVAEDHKWNFKQRSMDFFKDLKLKNQYCYHPFNTITIDKFGDIYTCICQAWLPISIGKVTEFNSFEEMMQSKRAREIQASILDGTYKYCDSSSCTIIKDDQLSNNIGHRQDTVDWINFALDDSCNLTCPSCRTEFKFVSQGTDYDYRISVVDHLVKLIENHNHKLKFTLSGDGDPFASSIYRHFLANLKLKNNKNVEIEIVTNGILVKDHWHKMAGVYDNIVRFKFSFDAGSKEVYEKIRRGGNWDKLLDSARYIADWKKLNKPKLMLTSNFVVQTGNYKDMINYTELCYSLGFDEINFQKIDNWGTFKNFQEHAVWQIDHPEYEDFLVQLQKINLNKKVNLTNLA